MGNLVLVRYMLAMATVVTMSESATACTCVLPPQDSTTWSRVGAAVESSDVVFEARIESVANGIEVLGEDDEDVWVRRHYTVVVLRQYRGSVSPVTMVTTGMGGGDCGFPFQIGQTYLVYADREEDQRAELETSICHRTRHIDEAASDLRLLRGHPPQPQDLLVRQTAKSEQTGNGRLCGTLNRADEAPLASAEVILWRVLEGGRREHEAEASLNEDRSYCFSSLEPGRYVISAAEEVPEIEESEDTVAKAFRHTPASGAYGGLDNPTPIDLVANQELHGLDFALSELEGFTVAGIVGKDGDMPQREVLVFLRAVESELFRHGQMRPSTPGSEFKFEGVPTGSYYLEILFLDRVWKDWLGPAVQLQITGDQAGLSLIPIRKN